MARCQWESKRKVDLTFPCVFLKEIHLKVILIWVILIWIIKINVKVEVFSSGFLIKVFQMLDIKHRISNIMGLENGQLFSNLFSFLFRYGQKFATTSVIKF